MLLKNYQVFILTKKGGAHLAVLKGYSWSHNLWQYSWGPYAELGIRIGVSYMQSKCLASCSLSGQIKKKKIKSTSAHRWVRGGVEMTMQCQDLIQSSFNANMHLSLPNERVGREGESEREKKREGEKREKE